MRPVLRWGIRLFKRDWRQQLLVIGLLTFAVAAALFLSVAVSNSLAQPDAEFGNANLLIRQRADDGPRAAANLDAVRRQFGTIEVIGHRTIEIPGSADTIDFRSQKADGPFSGPMLRVRAGRLPASAGEVALTNNAAADLHARLGGGASLGGKQFRVVGLVENPAELNEEFAVGVDSDVAAQSLAILANGKFDPQHANRMRGGATFSVGTRGQDDKPLAAAIVLLLSSVLLMLVALVATASFAVIAHRRQRQLGMLASVGASDAQLRLVMLSNGVAVGVVSAVVGAALGLLAWFALQLPLEHAFNHRLHMADVPLWIVGGTTLLALLAATGAAWWPARAVTRVPVTEALSGRPPRPTAAHRSVVLAAVLLVAGCVAMASGVNTVHGDANPWLLIPGTIAVVVGVLVLSPIAIRAMSGATRRAPLPLRLALRDLNRYQARSGAALAAIALGLGIAVCTVVVATVAKQHFDEGNLPNNQLLFTTRNDFIAPERVADLHGDVDAFARTLGVGAHVYDLKVVQNQVPPELRGKFEGEPLPPLELGRQVGPHSWRFVARIYVGTPELLARMRLHPGPDVDVLTVATGKVQPVSLIRRTPLLHVQHYSGPAYRSGPTTLITDAGLRKLGLPQQTSGWMVATDRPLTKHDVRAARQAAADIGMIAEARDAQASLLATRTIATAAGVLVALALLAMTIGLIRSEAGRDMQTLVATGASSLTRRALTASTSASLALLGSILGIGGAYLGLGAIYLDRISDLSHPPLPELVTLLVGLPLIAAAAGWLLSGREPVAIARHALD
ncbi:MAG: putative transport system permease protein [Actinomycetota bacterium]